EKDDIIARTWKTAIPPVKAAFDNGALVIELARGTVHANARGLSIYWPRAHTKQEGQSIDERSFDRGLSARFIADARRLYFPDDDKIQPADHPRSAAQLTFTQATEWGRFLHRYYNPVADASCGSPPATECE